jgi:hypothetical protein
MPRFHGRVKTFFQDRNSGYITELGETGTGDQTNVVTDRDVYFRASDMRVADPRAILRKSCTGHIVEYERESDEQGRYRGRDITNLYETALPCEEGLVIFKRYVDINREALRREGQRAIERYLDTGSKPDRAPNKKRGYSGRRHNSKRTNGGGGGSGGGTSQRNQNKDHQPYYGDDATSQDTGGGGTSQRNQNKDHQPYYGDDATSQDTGGGGTSQRNQNKDHQPYYGDDATSQDTGYLDAVTHGSNEPQVDYSGDEDEHEL